MSAKNADLFSANDITFAPGRDVSQWVRCAECGEVWSHGGEAGRRVCSNLCDGLCRDLTPVEGAVGYLSGWKAIEDMPIKPRKSDR